MTLENVTANGLDRATDKGQINIREKTLFLIRHANSRTNSGEYWADGPATVPLSEAGRLQAKEFANSWQIRPDLIVVSHYTRSIETATPLAEKYGMSPVTMAVQEYTFWDFQLSTQHEYDELRKSVNAYWKRLDPFEKGGGSDAENFEAFVVRCLAFRQWAHESSFKTCVCVSHGFFMHAFRAIMTGIALPSRDFMAYLRDTLTEAPYANLQVEKYSFPGHQQIV